MWLRYGRGAALALHVDRLSSHVVSAIINIQQVGSLHAEIRRYYAVCCIEWGIYLSEVPG